ncbi:MAG: antitoxin [Solirubrobacteraceae bacterium]
MTMLSFRVAEGEAADAQAWADRLGVDRSELLREALHQHLVALGGELEAERYEQLPATASERALEAVADWGPAEDWSDWGDDASR